MSSLWTKWMIGVSIIVMLAGLCFAIIFPYFIPQALEPFFTEITGMNLSELTQGEIAFHNLLSGVIGGTMFGWGVLIALLSFKLLKSPSDWIWSVVALSVAAWYILDTLASAMAGSSLNVLLNSGILILALPPLIAMRGAIVRGLSDFR
ncbi:MAG: hypothetical protein ACTSV2_15755 [Candidatus Thorarchaeota archaeon]